MVELKFNVSDVDFDSVIQALAGGLAGPAALAARALPDSAKEELAALALMYFATRIGSRARSRPRA